MPTAWTFLWRHQLESRCWWELHQIAQLQTQIATIAAWIHLVIGMATVALSKARQKVKDSRFQTYRLPLHTGFMIPAKVDLGVLQWGRLHCVVLSLPAPGRLTTSELWSISGLAGAKNSAEGTQFNRCPEECAPVCQGIQEHLILQSLKEACCYQQVLVVAKEAGGCSQLSAVTGTMLLPTGKPERKPPFSPFTFQPLSRALYWQGLTEANW